MGIIMGIAFSLAHTSVLRAQISDSLLNHLIPEAVPKDRNKITNWEYADILHATVYEDLIPFRAEYEQIKEHCIAKTKQKSTSTDDRIRLYAGIACYLKKSFTKENNTEALNYYHKVIVLAKGDTLHYKNLLEAYHSIISINIELYNMDSALVLLSDLTSIVRRDDSVSLSKLNSVYSFLYEKVRQYETSNYYRKRAIEYLVDYAHSKDQYMALVSRMVSNYVNLYKKYKKTEHRDSAFYYIKILESQPDVESRKWLSFASYLKSKLVVLDSNYSLSLQYNFDFDSLESKYGGSGVYASMSIHNNLSKYSNLIHLGHEDAIPELERLLANPFILDQKVSALNLLYEHFARKKQWQRAFEYLDLYQRTMDSMKVEENRNKLFETTQKFKVAEKEAIIKDLENRSLRTSRNIIGIIGISLLLITGLVAFQMITRIKAKRKQTEDDLKTEQLLNKLNQIELEKNEEKNRLLKQGEKAISNQRKEISKHIHDGISNGIAALRFYIEDLKVTDADPKLRSILSSLEEETNALYIQTREFMNELRGGAHSAPPDIISFLETLELKFAGTNRMRVKLDIDQEGISRALHASQQEQLFYIIKEAVVNVIKHAHATEIGIKLQCQADLCIVQINDNGTGFANDRKQGGMGIENIQSRTEWLKGKIEFLHSDKGTSLVLKFPLVSGEIMS